MGTPEEALCDLVLWYEWRDVGHVARPILSPQSVDVCEVVTSGLVKSLVIVRRNQLYVRERQQECCLIVSSTAAISESRSICRRIAFCHNIMGKEGGVNRADIL